ncbi:Sulf_transp domain-containing protein [Rubrivivax sp. A210]|uniref:YeeE/YedE thiosulfate transporter family protein n=1 Tax=Rubrivivax sp. A210 TaxID=2772301 RepID=UPI001918274D|nr:YeeE/YedE thiosulfate transporter family protein [Rubrivivax sp. A210]CAD5373906.1 Sulf_transp domain-containing protein [Rubrivivax sp. A210]
MNTLAYRSTVAPRAAPAAFLNPYLAGFLLGLVLLASYLLTGRGLGASAGFAALATALTGWVAPAEVQASAVHLKYWNEGEPLLNWTLFLLLGALAGAALSGWQARRFKLCIERGPRIADGQRLALALVGGFVAAWGAKLAKGCTSGQALTGGAMLNVGSLVFMAAVFAAAFGLAYFVRKAWL